MFDELPNTQTDINLNDSNLNVRSDDNEYIGKEYDDPIFVKKNNSTRDLAMGLEDEDSFN